MGIINQTGPTGQLAGIAHPQATFNYLFGKTALGDAASRRQSMLDVLKGEMNSLKPKLGREDQVRLEAHLEGFRQIERQLAQVNVCPVPSVDMAGIPSEPGGPDFATAYPLIVKTQLDLMVMALACDLTRVATMIMWNMYVVHSWVGSQTEHHELSHARGVESENGNFPDKALEAQAHDDRWSASMFAYLLDQLTARGLMDNTVVLWTSEMGDGASHFFGNIPMVLAGSGGGHFKTGRYLTFGDRRAYADPINPQVLSDINHNRLLVSICHAMGQQDVETFGAAELCKGGALDKLTS
jgi:hypothetical protein